ncbi:MAG: hypothetical protein V2A74_07105, partial [bacterium]
MRRLSVLFVLSVLFFSFSARPSPAQSAPLTQAQALTLGHLAVPPPMPVRSITPPTEPFPGETTVLDLWTTFTLFLPNGWSVPPSGDTVLTVHFHSGIWFAIQEHLQRGITGPLVAFYPGEGSTIYRKNFEDPTHLKILMDSVVAELKKRGAPPSTHISAVDISSFSAGYGAVREIVTSPDYLKLLRRIVLCDSMYASLDDTVSSGVRKPAPEHIAPWIPIAQAAARGEKTFVLSHANVPTPTYANTAECAAALIQAIGAPRETVAPDSIPAASSTEPYPLLYRSDIG